MDAKPILLILAGFAVAGTLWRSIVVFPVASNRGWVAVSAFIIAATGLTFQFAPDSVGLVAFVLSLVLITLPSLGTRIVQRLATQGQYRWAWQLARVVACLHPMDGWREYPRWYKAGELEQRGKPLEAAQIYEQWNPHSPWAHAANVGMYSLRGQWDELIRWFETSMQDDLKKDLFGWGSYLRALGEVGDLNKMLDGFSRSRRILEREIYYLVHCYLFIFAFCGQPTHVRRILEGPLSIFPQSRKAFWIATAELAAGNVTEAQQQFTELLNSDDIRIRSNAEGRLSRPPILAKEALTTESQDILKQAETQLDEHLRLHRASASGRRSSYRYGTLALIAINVAVFGLELVLGGSTNPETLYRMGALWTPAVLIEGEWWRLVAAAFLHFGPLHLALNMLALLLIGSQAETRFGVKRYLVLYTVSGLGSMLLIVVLTEIEIQRQAFLVGASGAIMGLIGALAAANLRAWRSYSSSLARRSLRVPIIVIGLQLVIDILVPQTSLLAHLSGALIGFTAALFMQDKAHAAGIGEGQDMARRTLLALLAVACLGVFVVITVGEHGADAEVYFTKGFVYFAQGDYEQAIETYTRAIELNPNYVDAYNNRGLAYARQGKHARAIADFDEAIQLDPSDARHYYNRGVTYYTQGEYARAIADFDEAIQLDPDFAEAYTSRGLAYYNRGRAYAAQHKYEQALTDFCEYAYVTGDETDPQLVTMIAQLETALGKQCPGK